MVKTLILILSFYSVNGISQTDNAVLSTPHLGRFYMGYSVVVQVSFLKKKVRSYRIECIGCDTIRKIDSPSNTWMLKPDSVAEVKLLIKNKRGKTIGSRKYKVFSPPVPTLFLDTVSGNSIVKTLPQILYLKHSEDVPLRTSFVIGNWVINIGDKVFKGIHNELSEEVKEYLLKTKSGLMVVEVNYYGVERGRKMFREIFEYNFD